MPDMGHIDITPPPPPPPPPRIQDNFSRTYSQKEPKRSVAPPLPTRAKSTDPKNTQSIRPGWRSIRPVEKRRSAPTVDPVRLERGSVGLLGPSTPRETSLLAVGQALEPNLISLGAASKSEFLCLMNYDDPQSCLIADMIAGPTSPAETLSLEPERDYLLSSPLRAPLGDPNLDRSSPKCEFARFNMQLVFRRSFVFCSRRVCTTKPALIYIRSIGFWI